MRGMSAVLPVSLATVAAVAAACSTTGTAPGGAGPRTVLDRRARLDEVMKSTTCAVCHPDIYAEHMQNTHGLAFLDPEPRLATRGFLRENCIRCHTPRPMFETGIGMVPIERHYDLEEGNTCMTCHWKADYDYADFRGGSECRTAFDDRVGTVQACATCHRVAGTPEQWMHAPAGAEAGRTCMDCHMPLVERPVAVGGPVRKVRAHTFPASRSDSQLHRAYRYEARIEGNEAVVRVTNSGAGHNFNTGSIQRAIESVVTVRDAAGKEVRTDRQVFKNDYWSMTGLGIPGPSIPAGRTREHRVPLGVADGTVECALLFKLYYPIDDGNGDLVRRLEHQVVPFRGVDPAAPPPPRAPGDPPPPIPAVSPEDAARPDLLVKYAHPATGVKEAVIPGGDGAEDVARLVALLEYPVHEARRRAGERLLDLGTRPGTGTPVVGALVRALGHWSDETFNQAMDLLVELRGAAEPEVRRALSDGNLYIRYHARKVLGRMGFPAAREEVRASLLASLGAAHPVDRRSAAEALGLFGEPEAAPALRPLLDDGDWDVVAAAAGALARLGDRGAVPALERTLSLATFPETRRDLAAALAALGSPTGIPVLLDGLDYPDDVLRARFFDAFFRATGLHTSYDPGAPRMERLEALARLRAFWARKGGAAALRAPAVEDGPARERAWDLVQTVGGGTDVLPGGEDGPLVESLVAMGAGAVPALIEGLTFPPGYTRKHALVCQALGRIGDPAAAPYLVRALRDRDLSVAEWACWALGRVGDPAAIPALRGYERRVVALALARAAAPGSEEARPATQALQVLAALGDARARAELAATGAGPAAIESAASPEDALAKARALRAADLYEEAVRVLRLAETRFGESAPLALETAWNLLMMAEEDRSRDLDPSLVESGVADARARFDGAVALDPRVAGRELLEAKILRHEERGPEARALLEEFLRATPGSADGHQELADLAARESDWATAEREFAAVAALLPDDGLAVLYATEAGQRLRRPVADLDAGYLRAAVLLPGYERPVQDLVRLHGADESRALDLLAGMARREPRVIWARIWISRLLRRGPSHDLPGAEVVAREAVALAPREPEAHLELAVLLHAEGRPVEAMRAYLASVEVASPGRAELAAEGLDRLLRSEEVVRAVPDEERSRAWDALVAKTPGTGRFAFDAARWYRDEGKDPERARRYLDAALRAEPDNPAYDLGPAER